MRLWPICTDMESILDGTEDAWQRGYQQGMQDALKALVRLVQCKTKLEAELAFNDPET